ncbi:MAG: MMPL family transporter, partial [Actinomycetota bacterium]|nr:MMPL family transporter [Actinomycetota bacterium]
MRTLTGFVLRHRRLVALFWLVALLAGGYASATISKHLSQSFSVPGTASYRANTAIVGTYHSGGVETPLVPVIRLPAGRRATDPGIRADLRAGFAAAGDIGAGPFGGSRVTSYGTTGNPAFVSADGRTTFGLIFTPTSGNPLTDPVIPLPAVRQALLAHLPHGSTVAVTGITPLTKSSSSKGVGVLSETIVGGLGALAVLAFVFASFLALVPLMIAAVSITTTFLAILGLTYLTDINFTTQFLVSLIGLGVAIDYSLLLITRWREETARGAENQDAITIAMATAGRAIAFSGVTVALGLLALIALPIPFIRGIGLGGMLIPLISVAVSITLLPAFLAGVGRRFDWPKLRHEAAPARGWTAWARLVVRQRWLAAILGLAVLVVLGVAALGMHVGDAGVNSLSQQGQPRAGVVLLERSGLPTGVLTPIEVLASDAAQTAQITSATAHLPGVHGVVAPAGPSWQRSGTALVAILPTVDGASSAGQATVSQVRRVLAVAEPAAQVGGYGASLVDQVHATYGNFIYVLIGLLAITFILLARAFRSLLLPAKAVILNLLSVGAVYGVMVLVWQEGHGSNLIWGLPATGAITAWIPLFVFAFLYGLSMDYEVFILARMREEYDATGSTTQAIVTGIGRTGRLVTSAALILFLAMAALASAPFTFLKIFATGVGAGILLDATVVRSLLVPALVSLFGRWNWWLPVWAARLLRVEPSPAVPEPADRESAARKPAA